MDLIGYLRRIMNEGPAETFDPSTDSLEAIRNFISTTIGDVQGLCYYGVVTAVPGANQFTIAGLAGYGETAFVDWEAFVWWDAGGAAAAPQGETRALTVYTNLGVFTSAAYTAAVGIGDKILLINPSLMDIVFDFSVPAADVADNVLSRDVVGNKTDTVASGSLEGLNRVPGTDAVTNANARDVVGDKTDTAVYANAATASLMRYIKGLLASNIAATGTFTTSSATVPADTGRGEVDNYWKGCMLMPLTGADALQPRFIESFANAGGVFTVDGLNPFTAVTGTVTYVILPAQNNETLLQSLIDPINTSIGRTLFTLEAWSLPQEEVSIPAAAADQALPDVTIAVLPDGAIVKRAIVMFKFRVVENTNVGANKLAGAQEIQVRDDSPSAWIDAINFVDDMFSIEASLREGGDVVIGAIDVSATVDGNDTYNFQWDEAVADLAAINFNDVQVGLKIWYSV